MAKIRCRCGAQIPDSTDSNPSKARFLRDVDFEAAEEKLVERVIGYFHAVQKGDPREWLVTAGFSPQYAASGPPPEDVLADLVTMRGRAESDLFECYNCGRLLVESSPNRFDFYAPEGGKPLGVFRKPNAAG
jgi:hypothetical protein